MTEWEVRMASGGCLSCTSQERCCKRRDPGGGEKRKSGTPTVVHTAPLTTKGLAELKLGTNWVHISYRNKGIPHSMLATTARLVPDGLQLFEACILLTLGNH